MDKQTKTKALKLYVPMVKEGMSKVDLVKKLEEDEDKFSAAEVLELLEALFPSPEKDKDNNGMKAVEAPEEGTAIHFKNKMWIDGTGKSKHLPKGKPHQVQDIHGERLIEKGAAVKVDAPKEKKSDKKAVK